jgi:hypothetical protein
MSRKLPASHEAPHTDPAVEDQAVAEPSPDADPGAAPDRRAETGTPRWVKVSGIIALALILLLIVMLLAGGGHGPRRHLHSDEPRGAAAEGRTPPSGFAKHGAQWP